MTIEQTHNGDLNTPASIMAELLPRAAYDVTYTPSQMVAGFAFEIQTGMHAFGSDRVSPFVTPPNTLAFTPAGCDVFSQSDTGGEYLTVAAPETCLGPLFDQNRWQQRRYNNAANQAAAALALTLRKQLLFYPDDTFGIEETAVQLFEHAAFQTPSNTQRKPASSMTPRRMRLFHERLESDLAAPLSLEALATELGLSSSYFIRAFKAATGGTPHAYIIRRRVGQARQMLQKSKAPIAAIAVETGFASQAHMTSVFRTHLGVTPRKYRQTVI